MSILKSVLLKGVWGERNFECVFQPDVNFLIGANGSGKTTVINLVAAVLTGNYDALIRTPFSSITCELLQHDDSMQCTKITVERPIQEGGSPMLKYVLSLSDGKKSYELFPSMNSYSFRMAAHPSKWISRTKSLSDRELLVATLHEIVNVKWLSVYRSPGKDDSDEHPHGESSVDRRLDSLNNRLVRYFSKLAGLKEEAINRFLSRVFVALLYTGGSSEPINEVKNVDLKKLRETMEAIFHRFRIGDIKSMNELSMFLDAAQKALEKNAYNWQELASLVGVLHLVKVSEEWNKTLFEQENILRPQHDFLEIINSMLKGKRLAINTRNELEAILDNSSAKCLSLSDLSSGEKQLLIIFGEALLQDRSEFIYIADEPELSLHVSWQEHLTTNLRKINPQAQVIFATHSPDIVSQYGDRVINMEEQ
jgi:energy-coupling factor transporter ATP-binding protein EcfA2